PLRACPCSRVLLLPSDQRRLAGRQLSGQIVSNAPIEAWIQERVGAPGRHRIETSGMFVLTAGATFEHADSSLDAVFYRMIQADVEVQELVFLECAPVAPV